jgi:endonuclease/exonuclease/phosphatase (EEP) superfamily protein YafD
VLNLQDGNSRHADVARLIRETNPDVVGLMELTAVWVDGLAPALDRFPHRRVSPATGAYGIGLYSKLTFRQATLERFPRDGPVSVVARFAIGRESFTLVLRHLHTPFAGDIHRRQFEALADARDRLGRRLAICGDLNSVPWSSSFRHLPQPETSRTPTADIGSKAAGPLGACSYASRSTTASSVQAFRFSSERTARTLAPIISR